MFSEEGDMYHVRAALKSDLNEGWVWLTDSGFEQRSVIKITNQANGKSVYCESLSIDENFLREYNNPPRSNIDRNKKTVVVNAWYRKKLDIEPATRKDLRIVAANHFWGKLQACVGHPQVVVRLAIWLALLSVSLGIIGIILGLCS